MSAGPAAERRGGRIRTFHRRLRRPGLSRRSLPRGAGRARFDRGRYIYRGSERPPDLRQPRCLRDGTRPSRNESPQLALRSLPATFPRPPGVLQGEADRYETTLDYGSDHRDIQIARRRLPNGGIIALIRDLTRRNSAQRERQRLEGQLVQASKLEAIGRLAGGIAHDFNNLLGAMLGFARFIEEDLPDDFAAASIRRSHHRRVRARQSDRHPGEFLCPGAKHRAQRHRSRRAFARDRRSVAGIDQVQRRADDGHGRSAPAGAREFGSGHAAARQSGGERQRRDRERLRPDRDHREENRSRRGDHRGRGTPALVLRRQILAAAA